VRRPARVRAGTPAAVVTVALLRASVTVALSVLLLVATALVVAPAASAHAMLVGTDPADGASLDTAPARVSFTFNEPVTVSSGGLRVYDADARRVDTGIVDPSTGETVAVGLPEDLAEGGYVAVYRVTSADSHPIGGVVTFTVGDGESVDTDVIAELFGGADGGVTATLGRLLRALAYAGTLLAAGAVAFAVVVARRGADRERARLLGRRAAYVGIAASVAALPVQGAAIGGSGLLAALSPVALADVLGSSFGSSTVVRVVGLVALAAAWRPGAADRPRGPVGPLALGAVAAASFALDGHQRTVEPTWLVAGADVVHLLGAAVWFGGLVLLAAALLRPVDGDAVAVAGLVRRFSSLALVAVVVLGVAGLSMAVPLVGAASALTTTGYGITLLAKTGLVVVILLVAAYNRQRLVPVVTAAAVPAGGSVDAPSSPGATRDAVTARGWAQLRRTVTAEAVLVTLVLGVTAALVVQRPAAEAAGLRGLYEVTAELGDELTVDVVVDPNRVGLNQIHVYVLDDTLRPATDVEDLRFELTYLPEDIGPIPIDPFFAGTGHWIANTDVVSFPGEWEIRIVAGIDRFTEATTTVVVPVAP
jgi:copper transport protein